MTTQASSPLPLILDDEWEPPPRPPNRLPAVIAVVVLVLGGAVFATIRAGVWEEDRAGYAEATQPRSGSTNHGLWYPDSEPLETLTEFARPRADSHSPAPAAPPAPRAPPPSVPRPAASAPRASRRVQTNAPSPRPTPIPGYLSVNSTPWAELSVDGRVVGNTPQLGIRVTPGQHRLVFAREGFEPHSAWVTVAPGATVKITGIALRPLAR
ncbi:MAG TPA: PEGA domain-containing protein [Gemmatimonadales bacterium]|nr:PEGA domain-containing protein [Gemmatimonadales bacterium]